MGVERGGVNHDTHLPKHVTALFNIRKKWLTLLSTAPQNASPFLVLIVCQSISAYCAQRTPSCEIALARLARGRKKAGAKGTISVHVPTPFVSFVTLPLQNQTKNLYNQISIYSPINTQNMPWRWASRLPSKNASTSVSRSGICWPDSRHSFPDHHLYIRR